MHFYPLLKIYYKCDVFVATEALHATPLQHLYIFLVLISGEKIYSLNQYSYIMLLTIYVLTSPFPACP